MAQHLCIVARDKPLLLGYLNIVLGHLTADGDELQIVIDRRPDPLPNGRPAAPRPATAPDQRHVSGVDELLRTQGYAIVSREDGVTWQLSDHGQERFEELDAVDELAEQDTARVPDRRRALLSGLAVVAVAAGVALALPSDSAYRLADGLFAVADHATSWMRPSREVPRATPGTETGANGNATATSLPTSSPPAVKEATPPATAALQAARATEREATEVRYPAEPPRAVESPRAVETSRAVATPPAVEPPPAVKPPRAVETSRAVATPPAVEPSRPVHPTRPVNAPRSAEPPRVATTTTAVSAAPRAEPATRRGQSRAESAATAKVDAVPAQVARPVALDGVPRFEMTRERDASGRTAAITVRVTDTAGRPLPSADVRIRRRFTDGGVRETQLEATTPVGSYRGPLPNSGPNTDGLVMRVLLGDLRYEVPLAE